MRGVWPGPIPAWTVEQVDATSAWARSLQAEPRLWLRARVRAGARARGNGWASAGFPEWPALADAVGVSRRRGFVSHPRISRG